MNVENGKMYLTDPNETIEFKGPIAVRFFETLETISKEIPDEDSILPLVPTIIGKDRSKLEQKEFWSKAADILDKISTFTRF